jgi:uncharacterized protein YuzE
MKFHYDSEVDVLSIRLAAGEYVESEEVRPGVILDLDAQGGVIGLEIHDASGRGDLGPFASFRFEAAGLAGRDAA